MQAAVSGIIWNYQEIGDGKGIPLLILHGWGRTGSEWVEIARVISKWRGSNVYVLDLPGFGGSGLPKVGDIHDYSRLVLRFCAYMKLKKVVVMGHSLGGRVGILMAASDPSLVEKLILINPAGVKPQSMKRVALQVFARIFRPLPEGLRRRVAGRLMDEDYQNSPVLHELYRAVVGEDLRKYLSQIKCQTWVIWGERDPILPLALTDIYKKLLPHPVVRVIWGAGHDPHLSHPQHLLRVLEEIWT